MSTITSYLPPGDGWLPLWLLVTSVMSIFNTVQSFITLVFTQEIYNNTTVTPLSARTFGTWTFVACLIRLYAAYNISNPLIYQLAIWTYGVAVFHFTSEWLVFGSAKWGSGLSRPMFVGSASLVWMLMQWSHYVQ
ncbi:MAG: ergosterol biosynthesis protein [Pycnora praestabilis]|nr:MAG: ergosterol biosynthesis protein [Pycnora praestabilis]